MLENDNKRLFFFQIKCFLISLGSSNALLTWLFDKSYDYLMHVIHCMLQKLYCLQLNF